MILGYHYFWKHPHVYNPLKVKPLARDLRVAVKSSQCFGHSQCHNQTVDHSLFKCGGSVTPTCQCMVEFLRIHEWFPFFMVN